MDDDARVRRILEAAKRGLSEAQLKAVWSEVVGVGSPTRRRLALPDPELPDTKAFMTTRDYLAASSRVLYGADEPPGGWIALALRQHPQREMWTALVALNRIRTRVDDRASLEAWYVDQLPTAAGERYRAVAEASAIPRDFLPRQAILLGVRRALLYDGEVLSAPEMPVLQAAILLTHAIASELDVDVFEGPDVWKDMPAGVLMEVVQNADFNRSDDLLAALDRHWRLWKECDAADVVQLRAPLADMAREATGLSVEELLMHGLFLDTLVGNWAVTAPVGVRNPFGAELGFDASKADRFMSLVSMTEEEARAGLRQDTSRWAMLSFEARPIIRLSAEEFVVVDREFLQARVMTGVYWNVHDAERARSDRARSVFATGFGKVTEKVVLDDLREISQTTLRPPGSPPQVFFTEREIIAAYSARGRRQGKKNADAVMWTSGPWIVAEIVNGVLSIPSRQHGDLNAFRADTMRLIIDKLEQLDATAKDILANPQALTGVLEPADKRVQPVLVQGGQFPVHPATIVFIDGLIADRRLLQDSRINRLAIVEARELDMLFAELERGNSIGDVLGAWLTSERRAYSLKNYLVSRAKGVGPEYWRPKRLKGDERVRTILNQLPGDHLQTESGET